MAFLNPWKVDGVKYTNVQDLQRAKRLKALKKVNENKGIKSKLWNLGASKAQKDQAKRNYEDMLAGGSGVTYY